jgi:hypothetical protein
MQTPALRQFLHEVGKVVHHLNSIAVGLSAVEQGLATKPAGLDISWHPADPVASGRQARSFALRSTIVMVSELLGEYIAQVARFPSCKDLVLPPKGERYQNLEVVKNFFSISEVELFLDPLLLVHWRNRIIHRKSNAGLTSAQRDQFISCKDVLFRSYKNLDPSLLLNHFDSNSPTLKDTSSLVAMTINFVKSVDGFIREPSSEEEVMEWIALLGIEDQLDRVKRVSSSKGKLEIGLRSFLDTHCPNLTAPYFAHVVDEN